MSEKSYGQIAFEAFCASVEIPVLPFDDLGKEERRGWEAVGKAVIDRAAEYLAGAHMPDVIEDAGGLGEQGEPMGAVYARALQAHEIKMRG